MAIKTWVFGRYFLENEQVSELSLQGKQLTVFVANDKIQAFRRKSDFWKMYICHGELDSFSKFERIFLGDYWQYQSVNFSTL